MKLNIRTTGRILLLASMASIFCLAWFVLVPHEEYQYYIILEQYETDLFDPEGGLLLKVSQDNSQEYIFLKDCEVPEGLQPGDRIRIKWVSTTREKRIDGVWPA